MKLPYPIDSTPILSQNFSIGGLDYSNLTDVVTVTSTPFLNCTTIPIEADSVVESREQFFVTLSSNDQAVIVNPQVARVFILDTSGIQSRRELYVL